MTALANLLRDLAAQARLRGDLPARLAYVLGYYGAYRRARGTGLDRAAARLAALGGLAASGASFREARLLTPDGDALLLDLYSASFLAKEILVERAYERPGFVPEPGWAIVDAGAHQGLFSVPAARRVGPSGRLLAVEAHPGNHRRLSGNLAAAGLSWAKAVRLALWDSAGVLDLRATGLISAGHSVVFESIPGEERSRSPVEALTLDALLERESFPSPDLIKIDVEGAFLQVLRGAERTLSARPRLVLEAEGPRESGLAAARHLEARGYRVELSGGMLFARPG